MMRIELVRHTFLILLLGVLALPVQAQVTLAVQHFDEGNQRYAQGDYAGAIAAYEQALESGHTSGALYANMGNAYYRLDELGQAIRYYEKARRLIPENPELLHNLTIVRSRIDAPFSSIPTPIWVSWWKRYVVRQGALPFFIVGLLLYIVSAVLIAQRIWTGTRNAWHRRSMALTLLGGLLFLIMGFGASLDKKLDQRAVVISDRVALRETPQAEASSEVELNQGVLLDILQTQEAWIEVRLPNGVTGWILASDSAEI